MLVKIVKIDLGIIPKTTYTCSGISWAFFISYSTTDSGPTMEKVLPEAVYP
jgi:hypothetical protein